jgi:hypothetical protein
MGQVLGRRGKSWTAADQEMLEHVADTAAAVEERGGKKSARGVKKVKRGRAKRGKRR